MQCLSDTSNLMGRPEQHPCLPVFSSCVCPSLSCMCLLLPLLHPQPLPQGTNATYIACAQKLIVVLTVDSGDTIASQDLSFQLSCVGRCAAATEQASHMA